MCSQECQKVPYYRPNGWELSVLVATLTKQLIVNVKILNISLLKHKFLIVVGNFCYLCGCFVINVYIPGCRPYCHLKKLFWKNETKNRKCFNVPTLTNALQTMIRQTYFYPNCFDNFILWLSVDNPSIITLLSSILSLSHVTFQVPIWYLLSH